MKGARAFREALLKGAEELGIELKGKELEAFSLYLQELNRWNRKVNLTALRGKEEIAVKHFLDSLTVVPFLGSEDRLLDIGTGAGFPGMVLKIHRPSLEVLLLDASQKRAFFLRHLVRTLGLQEVEVLHARVEDPEVIERYRGRFDLVVSRAFTSLVGFLEAAEPYLAPGGRALAMKGPKVEGELASLKGLPFSLEERKDLRLPFSMGERTLLLFRLSP